MSNQGATPLALSVEEGHLAVVNALIAAGALVERADRRGLAPLHIAANAGRPAFLRALLAAGGESCFVMIFLVPYYCFSFLSSYVSLFSTFLFR